MAESGESPSMEVEGDLGEDRAERKYLGNQRNTVVSSRFLNWVETITEHPSQRVPAALAGFPGIRGN